ncbi:MAG: YifB family Mg chelatase-like AAA ATPase [Alphaproteobacteria bacterium]
MVAKIWTVAFRGIEVLDVEVQVHFTSGVPTFQIVGLADKAVAESRERIRNALHAIGLGFPMKKIAVNLAPASLQKEGTHYDVPIALAILAQMGILNPHELEHYTAVGELALDGTMHSVAGVLPAAFQAAKNNRKLICPSACGSEAAWIENLDIIAAPNLLSLVNYFKGNQVLDRPEPKMQETSKKSVDFSEIKGQGTARRVLEVAAAGGHNVLMVGPPGSGKSMLAQRLSTILPPLEPEEALELSMVYSVAGMLREGKLLTQRPFRDPHHSASVPALVGGGIKAKPGEISLAHKGVLFLDELPEFESRALEALRQPLETGYTVIARANSHVTYPSEIQFIAAMNPCRCGYMDDPSRACVRVPICGQQYTSKISGPLLDRMDMHIHVPALKPQELSEMAEGESSESIQKRVTKARLFQRKRLEKMLDLLEGRPHHMVNAKLSGKLLEAVLQLDPEAETLVHQAADRFKLSARSYYRVLKVSRTIADMDESNQIRKNHVAEALCYRQMI